MTWVESQPEWTTPADRIGIHQAIISLVQEADRPLSTNDIRHRLVALRGVNTTFGISAIDPLIRVEPGLWGLNDRDIPVKRGDQPSLHEDLVETLQKKTSGIHISEIKHITPRAPQDLTAEMIFSLAIHDSRMRVATGQYLYLEAWGTPRRDTLLEALRHVMSEEISGLTLKNITTRIAIRIQREIDTSKISTCLQALGAKFDSGNRTWVLSSGETDQADEEDFAAERTMNPIR